MWCLIQRVGNDIMGTISDLEVEFRYFCFANTRLLCLLITFHAPVSLL